MDHESSGQGGDEEETRRRFSGLGLLRAKSVRAVKRLSAIPLPLALRRVSLSPPLPPQSTTTEGPPPEESPLSMSSIDRPYSPPSGWLQEQENNKHRRDRPPPHLQRHMSYAEHDKLKAEKRERYAGPEGTGDYELPDFDNPPKIDWSRYRIPANSESEGAGDEMFERPEDAHNLTIRNAAVKAKAGTLTRSKQDTFGIGLGIKDGLALSSTETAELWLMSTPSPTIIADTPPVIPDADLDLDLPLNATPAIPVESKPENKPISSVSGAKKSKVKAKAEAQQSTKPEAETKANSTSIEASGATAAATTLHGFASPRPLIESIQTQEESDKFLQDLLDDQYRGQAETFIRSASSRVVSRSASTASSARSVSLSVLRARNSYRTKPITPSGRDDPTEFYTPTRTSAIHRNNKTASFAALQREAAASATPRRVESSRTPSERIKRTERVVLEPFHVKSPPAEGIQSPHLTYGHRVVTLPSIPTTGEESPAFLTLRSRKLSKSIPRNDSFYFTTDERKAINQLVDETPHSCDSHEHCTDCRNTQFALYENKAMTTSMPPEERQKIVANNRSLRNIRTELENLIENGVISDALYDTILNSLPSESSLNAASARPAASPIPTNAFSNLRVSHGSAAAQSASTPPPLPGQATPAKPELGRAIALYRYSAEPEDCSFEVGDTIIITEYTNVDWWQGINQRTGQEGVFPQSYVQLHANAKTPGRTSSAYGSEKSSYTPAYQGQTQQAPPPPGPSNPYNSSVPPMAVAQQANEAANPNKGGEMGKKIGKKLGNAALFGAGASLGGNIVNAIF